MSAFVLLIIRLALTLAVYAFVGWAVMVLWQDLRRQTALVKAPPVRPLHLRPVASAARLARRAAALHRPQRAAVSNSRGQRGPGPGQRPVHRR